MSKPTTDPLVLALAAILSGGMALAETAPELRFHGYAGAGATPTELAFTGLGEGKPAAPPLSLTGWGAAVAASDALAFTGFGQPSPVPTPALTFSGLKADGPTTNALVFRGFRAPSIDAAPLALTGYHAPDIATAPLTFTGFRATPPDLPGLHLTGWGHADAVAATQLSHTGWKFPDAAAPALRFTGPGRQDPIVTIEDFSNGPNGWTANDGPTALQVDRTGALCLFDNEPGDLTIYLPPAFLGDWGSPRGQFEFTAYYEGSNQWPLVVTLRSPAGSAVFRDGLTNLEGAGSEHISRPLADIWWEEDGDWDAIIANVTQVEIVVDIKDGHSGANEICIDDVVLTRVPRLPI